MKPHVEGWDHWKNSTSSGPKVRGVGGGDEMGKMRDKWGKCA